MGLAAMAGRRNKLRLNAIIANSSSVTNNAKQIALTIIFINLIQQRFRAGRNAADRHRARSEALTVHEFAFRAPGRAVPVPAGLGLLDSAMGAEYLGRTASGRADV